MPMNRPKTAALAPMRHNSERVLGKNYRQFAGKPLYHWILETLVNCPAIDVVAVDTDSPVIMEGVAEAFPQVMRIPRPVDLVDGEIPMNKIIAHDMELIDADVFVQTHCTNPLLRSATVSRALAEFHNAGESRDSLFSVTPRQARFWTSEGKPANHDPRVLLRTQDLPPFYEENSNLYIFSRQSFLERGNRIGDKPIMFPIDMPESWDIDTEYDFSIGEMLMLKFLDKC